MGKVKAGLGQSVRLERYRKYYNDSALWEKLNAMPRSTVITILEKVLLLRELLFDKGTPYWVKAIIIGVLGYVIFPFDLYFDFIPIVGFLDDISVVGLVLGNLENLVTDEMKTRVEIRMAEPLEAQPTDG
jgi:uncharacterized membrane protein YkvA (DUF1232 family)